MAPLHVRVHGEEDWAGHVFRLWMCGLGDLWRGLFWSRQLEDAAYRGGGGGGAHQHCEQAMLVTVVAFPGPCMIHIFLSFPIQPLSYVRVTGQ